MNLERRVQDRLESEKVKLNSGFVDRATRWIDGESPA